MNSLKQNVSVALFSLVSLLGLVPCTLGQAVKLSSTSLNFGNQALGVASTALGVVLTNTDAVTPLAISAVLASGDYTESDNCSGLLKPLGTCTLLITFKPNALGTQAGVVTLTDDANNSPQLITTTGKGVVLLGTSTGSLSFGTVAVGSSSSPQTITVTNDLKETVTIDVSASGDYEVAGSGASPCPLIGGLAAFASCALSVRFQPTFAAAISGALTVTQNFTSTPLIIPLSGTGSGGSTPPLSFNPTSLSFPATPLGTTTTQQVTVTNHAAVALTISEFSASGDFVALGGNGSPCGGLLGAGKQCTILVNFSPATTGTIHGVLTISSNGSVKTQVINLTAVGTLPMTVSPASLTFSSLQQGTVSSTKTVTLTNHLSTALSLTNTAVSGDFAQATPTGTACGSSLPAFSSCTIGVSFQPLARTGTITGALTVTSSASSSPLIIPLTGSAFGQLPRFAYVANINDNTLSEYTINYRTGQLRHNGYVLAGNQPISVVVHPSGRFVYAANFQDHTIGGYTVNAGGRLTAIGSFATGSRPVVLAITPSGRFAYVVNDLDNTVSAFVVNTTTGGLTAVTGSPFATGTQPIGVTTDPLGKFLYVTNVLSNTVSAYAINSTTGALTQVVGSPFATGQGPGSVVTDPFGKFLYVANGSDNTVSAYKINALSGALTSVGTSPTDVFPVRAIVDHSGKFLYALNSTAQDISAFSINSSTGALTALTGSPFPAAGKFPTAVAIDAMNQFLYSADQGANEVSIYSINRSTGALTLARIVSARSAPFAIAMSSGSVPVTYTPRSVYLVSEGNPGPNTISGFAVNPSTGTLTAISGSTLPLPAGNPPNSVSTVPTGRFLYVPNENVAGSISAYTVNLTTGALTQVSGSPFAAGSFTAAVDVDPSGRFLYAANFSSDNVSAYAISPSTGALTELAGSPFSLSPAAGPCCLSVDPSGRFLYVSNTGRNTTMATMSEFTIDPASGALTAISGSPLALPNTSTAGPISMAVDATGRFVVVLIVSSSENLNGVFKFTVDPSTGAATAVTPGVFAGFAPRAMTLDPFGEFIFVSDNIRSLVEEFILHPFGDISGGFQAEPVFTGVSLGVDPSAQYVYAVEQNNGVTGFSIGAFGQLTDIPGLPIRVGGASALTVTGKIH